LREQLRVRSFRNVLVVTSTPLAALAVVLAVTGYRSPTTIPLCFAPEAANQAGRRGGCGGGRHPRHPGGVRAAWTAGDVGSAETADRRTHGPARPAAHAGRLRPGLTALDTSVQILAWALVFGYAQQLFTRLVDQQAHTVLGAVRGGGDRARARTPESAG
jgi:hypothetical protein